MKQTIQVERNYYLNQLINRKENGLIKIITGLRRSGKSFLLFTLYKKYLLENGVKENQIIELALDDDENREYRIPDNLFNYLKGKTEDSKTQYYIFLDEVQFAISDEELKKNEPIRLYGILNGLLKKDNVDVYITGSNSKFLSSDVMTEFRGRGDEVKVFPFSFAEFYSGFTQLNLGDKFQAFREYQTYGGLPQILNCKTESDKAKYLDDLFKNLYLKDISERNKLRNDIVLDNIVDILASSIGSLTNPTKLANTFNSNKINTTDKTISAYIEYLENSFLISKAKRYDIKGKKYINSLIKYYFCDVGLRNKRLNFRQQELSHIMENIIYNELISRGFNVDVGVVEKYSTDKNNKKIVSKLEIDFVCNKGSSCYYIQSAFSIPDQEKMNQETASFDRVKDSFTKIILVNDNINPYTTEKGYKVINIIDFLLGKDYL